MHLDQKDPNDYTSHEWFVADLLSKNEEARCFPINRALTLIRQEDDDAVTQTQAEHTRTLDQLGNQLNMVLQHLRDVERRLARN